jgi:Fe-Mn family superoxide dismutase
MERITTMDSDKFYTLPKLPYDYAALKPYISEEQLKLHHQKHHQAYVNGANAIYEKFDKARKENADFDVKATLRELSFHLGGFKLHNLFWENLAPAGKGGGGMPKGALAEALDAEFGSSTGSKRSSRRPLPALKAQGGPR